MRQLLFAAAVIAFIGVTGSLFRLFLFPLLQPVPSTRNSNIRSISTSTAAVSPTPTSAGQWISIEDATTSGFYSRFSSVFYYSKKLAGADVSTFQVFYTEDGHALFAKDKAHVYGIDIDPFLINGADPATFSVLGQDLYTTNIYAKDDKHAYWFNWQDWGVINGVDPATFTTNEDTLPYAKDGIHVFYGGDIFSTADPMTFSVFPLSNFAKDRHHVYYNGGGTLPPSPIAGADPNTFLTFPGAYDPGGGPNGMLDPSAYGKDKDSVICRSSELSGADPNSFRPIGSKGAIDKNNYYSDCGIYDPTLPP